MFFFLFILYLFFSLVHFEQKEHPKKNRGLVEAAGGDEGHAERAHLLFLVPGHLRTARFDVAACAPVGQVWRSQ